jgi:hypothetical protein
LGCAETRVIHYAAPHPHVDLHPKRGVRLKLDMHAIADQLKIDSDEGEVLVMDWRGTLAAAYSNSLREQFPRVAGLPVLTIELLEATPSFGAEVQLKFRARLIDSAGNLLASSQGSVGGRGDDLSVATASAVERMFEKMAVDLLGAL